MKRRVWSAEEIAVLMAAYPDSPTEAIARQLGLGVWQVYSKAARMGLKKSAAYLESPAACRLRRGDNIGAATRFKAGMTTWNKGTHYVAGGRSAETRFKKGQKPHTWHPIGHERLSKEGYLQRKLTDTGYTPRDYVPVHHIVWRAAGKDIPAGFRLCFKNGDKTDIRVDNLELVSMSDLMRRNTIHNYPKEIAELVQLRGAITRQINKRKGKRHGQEGTHD